MLRNGGKAIVEHQSVDDAQCRSATAVRQQCSDTRPDRRTVPGSVNEEDSPPFAAEIERGQRPAM